MAPSFRPRLLLATALLFLSLTPSTACRCVQPSLAGDFYNPRNVNFIRAKVLKVLEPPTIRGQRRIFVRIQLNYKGCPRNRFLVLRTPASSATCGANLSVGTVYVIPVRRGLRPRIDSCQFIREFKTLSKAEKLFLKTRLVCCGRSCKCLRKTGVVQCFRQPCSAPETCDVKGAKCVDNYCGGCFAEWFDMSGNSVCQKPPLF